MSYAGKTTLVIELARRNRSRWKFFFDPEREFSMKLRFPCSTHPDDMARRAAAKQPVAFDPCVMFPSDMEAAAAYFSKWVLNFCRITHPQNRNRYLVNGPKLLVIDEIQNFTQTGKGGIPPELAEVLNQGRRHELDLLLVSQAPNYVHDNIRLQLQEIYTLRHEDKLPLEWLAEMGFDPERVKRLKVPGGFLCHKRWANGNAPDDKRKTGSRPDGSRLQAGSRR